MERRELIFYTKQKEAKECCDLSSPYCRIYYLSSTAEVQSRKGNTIQLRKYKQFNQNEAKSRRISAVCDLSPVPRARVQIYWLVSIPTGVVMVAVVESTGTVFTVAFAQIMALWREGKVVVMRVVTKGTLL